MAITVARIASEVTLKFKDLDSANYPTSPNFFNFLADVHNMILSECRLYPDVEKDITLDGVNGEFAYDSTILKMWSARHMTSSTVATVLRPSSIDELDYTERNWRETSAGTPVVFYENGGMVGFYPRPSTATGGSGYPKVALWCSTEHTLAAGDSLPGQVKSPWAWVYGVCWLWAADRHSEFEESFRGKFLAAQDRLKDDIFAKVARGKPFATFDIPKIRH